MTDLRWLSHLHPLFAAERAADAVAHLTVDEEGAPVDAVWIASGDAALLIAESGMPVADALEMVARVVAPPPEGRTHVLVSVRGGTVGGQTVAPGYLALPIPGPLVHAPRSEVEA